jgi:hypothetical protein
VGDGAAVGGVAEPSLRRRPPVTVRPGNDVEDAIAGLAQWRGLTPHGWAAMALRRQVELDLALKAQEERERLEREGPPREGLSHSAGLFGAGDVPADLPAEDV